ncbi:MAG: SCP2 sterol-binding domain-containing protein [Saprospiraceae bacterium]|nr:SCP2 sterol-binding domain-containing protein [Saprospiraceae bacterium]MCF8248804.1 SCP2 sterol-binding domain-containing protein [Saprospiraceae bacterium]MCF8279905.1 SCP2 sterol-binding domain-containing protein [Bacteroidales bacterium]MCF8310089.1 SCP2 sterol-binding domain-containing protein [Saprospiraceae bacterium]MCF8438989.1 SCP2 sterol-binding domain-containing protein [Saprospiraceae bacterium]
MDLSKIPKLTINNAKDFITTLPLTVNPDFLKDVDTNFHFDIEGDGGGQFSVIVKDNKMEVFEHFEGEPKCKVTAKEKNFTALLRGELNPMMAVFTGKLKITNTAEIMKYAKLFGII